MWFAINLFQLLDAGKHAVSPDWLAAILPINRRFLWIATAAACSWRWKLSNHDERGKMAIA
jgi:hypothetical protein